MKKLLYVLYVLLVAVLIILLVAQIILDTTPTVSTVPPEYLVTTPEAEMNVVVFSGYTNELALFGDNQTLSEECPDWVTLEDRIMTISPPPDMETSKHRCRVVGGSMEIELTIEVYKPNPNRDRPSG